MLGQRLYYFRYLCLIAVFCSVIGSFLMFLIGAVKTVLAFTVVFFDVNTIGFIQLPGEISQDTATMVLLIESVDHFLFGVVLMIFGFGLYSLFIYQNEGTHTIPWISWLKISNISQLKTLLAQVIIMILFVTYLERIIMTEERELGITALIIPVSILFLALGLRFMQIDHS